MGYGAADARERLWREVLIRGRCREAGRSRTVCQDCSVGLWGLGRALPPCVTFSPPPPPHRDDAKREEQEQNERDAEEGRERQEREERKQQQEEQRAAKIRVIQEQATSARGKIKHYRYIANATTQEFAHLTWEQRRSVLQECDELERWINERQQSTTVEHIQKSEWR